MNLMFCWTRNLLLAAVSSPGSPGGLSHRSQAALPAPPTVWAFERRWTPTRCEGGGAAGRLGSANVGAFSSQVASASPCRFLQPPNHLTRFHNGAPKITTEHACEAGRAFPAFEHHRFRVKGCLPQRLRSCWISVKLPVIKTPPSFSRCPFRRGNLRGNGGSLRIERIVFADVLAGPMGAESSQTAGGAAGSARSHR